MDAGHTERMTADQFIAWSMQQPKGKRYELRDGTVYPMVSERYRHAIVKGLVYTELRAAIKRAGLACVAIPDGMAVRIDAGTVYEPVAAVRCNGEPILDDAVEYGDPLVVVEVLSPPSRSLDSGAKLIDYFRVRSLRHYLVVDAIRLLVVHHQRTATGAIKTSIVDGEVLLDSPGLTLELAAFLA